MGSGIGMATGDMANCIQACEITSPSGAELGFVGEFAGGITTKLTDHVGVVAGLSLAIAGNQRALDDRELGTANVVMTLQTPTLALGVGSEVGRVMYAAKGSAHVTFSKGHGIGLWGRYWRPWEPSLPPQTVDGIPLGGRVDALDVGVRYEIDNWAVGYTFGRQIRGLTDRGWSGFVENEHVLSVGYTLMFPW